MASDMNILKYCILHLENKPALQSNLSAEETKSLLETLVGLQQKVLDLVDKNKPSVVHMGGVKFDWIKTNIAIYDVGLIVDHHTVMEHILSALEGEDFINSFLKIHTLKIETITQGLAMINFERPVPKFLSSGYVRVIKDNSSYLDKVQS